jgi:protein-tyrosine kinase
VKRTWTPCLDAIPALRERDEVVEQFRGLRSHLAQARLDAPLKTVLISSGMASEGKSFVALNLAVSLARSSRNRVLLIDGDLRRPTLHRWLGASNNPGLSEYLEGGAELSEIMQKITVKPL